MLHCHSVVVTEVIIGLSRLLSSLILVCSVVPIELAGASPTASGCGNEEGCVIKGVG